MNNNYTHLIILDFEATCCDKSPPKPQEIIEFPSVLFSLEANRIVDEFQSFVKPVHNPVLTDFCKSFTSIQQKDVDKAKVFSEVLCDHWNWIQSHGLDETNALIVTCGDWDLANMFPSQCFVSSPPVENLEPIYTQWLNIKKTYCKVLKVNKAAGMAGMLRKLNLELKGHHHRGIDDCKNITEIVKTLIAKGAKLSVSGTLPLSKYPPILLNFSLGERKEKAVLKVRSLSSLYGLIGKVFQCKITELKLADGTAIEKDEDLRTLRFSQEITLLP